MPPGIPDEFYRAGQYVVRLAAECWPSLNCKKIVMYRAMRPDDMEQWVVGFVSEQEPRPDLFENLRFKTMLFDYVNEHDLCERWDDGKNITTQVLARVIKPEWAEDAVEILGW